MNVTGHDPDFAFAGRNNTWTIWTDKPRRFVEEIFFNFHHIERGNSLSNTNDDGDTCASGFHDRVRRECGWYVNDRGVSASLFHRVGDSIENRNALVLRSAFAGSNATDNLRSVLDHLFGVEGSFFAGDTLNYQTRIFIDENTQRSMLLMLLVI